ncbi:MAG TPA: hypothetical protein PKA05_23520, partial [Roseiflexaceae bacterium]|nr:hypothetical protein [Roseiflexaceae bacterium]
RLNDTPLRWQFRTMGDLAVLQVEPPADATEVPADARRISVRFNHPVVPLTDVAGQASLPQPLTIFPPLAGSGTWL